MEKNKCNNRTQGLDSPTYDGPESGDLGQPTFIVLPLCIDKRSINKKKTLSHLRSYKKVITLNRTPTLFIKLGSLFRLMMASKTPLYPQDEYNRKLNKYNTWWPSLTLEELLTLHTLTNIAHYLDNERIYSRVVFYYQIRDEPKRVMEDIFGLLNIDLCHLDNAVKALERDSQNGVAVPRGETSTCKISEQDEINANKLYAEFGFKLSTKMSEQEFKEFFVKRGCKMCF